MQRPTLVLRDLRSRHRSAASALLDPVLGAEDTPKCLKEALLLLRDTPNTVVQMDYIRKIKKEPCVLDAVARKFRRYEPAGSPIGSWDLDGVRTLLMNTATKWAMPPNLQPAYEARYTSHTIVGIDWPWFGNPDFLSVTGDGMGLLKFRVLATDEGGPCRFRLLDFSDPELNAFIASPAVPPFIGQCRAQYPVINGPHYQQRFNDRMAEMGLLGEIDLGQFEAVLREVLRPPSYWQKQAEAPSRCLAYSPTGACTT